MNKEIEKVFTERGFTNIEQMATMFDYYKQEIERLNKELDKTRLSELDKEYKLNQVREYITKQVHRNQQFYEMDIENILEILDKGE